MRSDTVIDFVSCQQEGESFSEARFWPLLESLFYLPPHTTGQQFPYEGCWVGPDDYWSFCNDLVLVGVRARRRELVDACLNIIDRDIRREEVAFLETIANRDIEVCEAKALLRIARRLGVAE